MKIREANYVRGSISQRIHAAILTRTDYIRKYRGFLFCTELGCKALMSFVERKKNNLKFFRTWSKSKHKEGCPYEVLYDEGDVARPDDRHVKFINLTDNHIMDKLLRTYEAIGKIEDIPKHREIGEKGNNKKTKIGGVSLRSTLNNEGENLISGRQPYLLTRYFDKIDSKDIGEVRCIVGTVHSIRLHEKHGYINLTPKGPNSVKVCFTEAFVKSEKNVAQYPNFHIFKQFHEQCKKNSIPVICCCVGRLGYAKLGVNVYPDRYNGFILNGRSYYDILREINEHIKNN